MQGLKIVSNIAEYFSVLYNQITRNKRPQTPAKSIIFITRKDYIIFIFSVDSREFLSLIRFSDFPVSRTFFDIVASRGQ